MHLSPKWDALQKKIFFFLNPNFLGTLVSSLKMDSQLVFILITLRLWSLNFGFETLVSEQKRDCLIKDSDGHFFKIFDLTMKLIVLGPKIGSFLI